MTSVPADTAPIGVLGLQGDFDAHHRAFAEAGIPSRVIRFPKELEDLGGLVLPGGESTTQLKLMETMGFFEAIERFHRSGRAIFGTCAGAILVAERVTNPDQRSLGLIDIDIERNAYGRQRESFETGRGRITTALGKWLKGVAPAQAEQLELVLIRAPRITRCGPQVEILVTHEPAAGPEEPVLVRQGAILAGTFHPEMGADRRIHQYFHEMARGATHPV